jgi:hypothetical protein
LTIDYPDRASEATKAGLAEAFQRGLTDTVKQRAARRLRELVGVPGINSYVDRARSALAALPQEIRFVARKDSSAAVFEDIAGATAFLENPRFDFSTSTDSFVYQITYTDGSEF